MQQATQRRRTQAERRAETESRLLQAAMDLVAEGGVGAVTVAATGARAGYSRGIVNHHFGSRRALLDALAREMQGRFSAPKTEGSGLARVLALVDAYLDGLSARARDTQVFLVLWTEAIASDPDLRPVFAERDEAFRTSMATAVAAGMTDGTVRADADPDAAAVALVALMRGVGLQRLLSPDAVDLGAVRAEVHAMLERGLAGATADRGAGRRRASPARPPSS